MYVVEPVRVAAGTAVNTVFPPLATGWPENGTQVAKASAESWIEPVHAVPEVLVVIEAGVVAWLKVTLIDVLAATAVVPSAGLVKDTASTGLVEKPVALV